MYVWGRGVVGRALPVLAGALLALAATNCHSGPANACIVSPGWRSAPIINAATGATVGQAYPGFAVALSGARDGRAYFSLGMDHPAILDTPVVAELYIPLKYMKKANVPPSPVIAAISLDTIVIKPGACLSAVKDGRLACLARFDGEAGPLHFITKTENGYQFVLGMNMVYAAETDVTVTPP